MPIEVFRLRPGDRNDFPKLERFSSEPCWIADITSVPIWPMGASEARSAERLLSPTKVRCLLKLEARDPKVFFFLTGTVDVSVAGLVNTFFIV